VSDLGQVLSIIGHLDRRYFSDYIDAYSGKKVNAEKALLFLFLLLFFHLLEFLHQILPVASLEFL